MKVFTAFSGYDSQCMALDRLHSNFNKFNYELIGWSEIDKYAIQAHNIIYPQYKDRNYGDISKINWDKVDDFDLLTYSSPCTDFSAAGLQKGGEKGSGTRSSLLWECERAINSKRPKYLLMENVSALVSKKFIKLFNKWQSTLESYGYTNYAKVLNAKDFGVPQNRERIFMVSVRNDVKDKFYFPQPFKSNIRLKDVLEDKVDEKYYIDNSSKDKRLTNIIINKNKELNNGNFKFIDTYHQSIKDLSLCIKTNINTSNLYYISEPRVNIAGNINPSVSGMNGNVFSTDGVGPTITTNKGDGNKILEPKTNIDFKIRKLTPRECFRLMDVPEDNINKLLDSGISNSQLYKLAGNSIVVNCLYHIFRKLFIETKNDNIQTELF